MGLVLRDCQLLMAKRNKGLNYKKVLMLGRQTLFTSKAELQKLSIRYLGKDVYKNISFSDRYSEPFFSGLGAMLVESIDNSEYENATIIHDLNEKIPDNFKNRYTVVLDGGTLEHVFNFPLAIRNAMEMVELGGHYIGITPTNNYSGHGFYQFSPELYFRIFTEENGFVLTDMLIRSSAPNAKEWYKVNDPDDMKTRVQLINRVPAMIVFIAKKIENKEIFKKTPQQSDYMAMWNAERQPTEHKKIRELAKKIPTFLRPTVRKVYKSITEKHIYSKELGRLNQKHFKRVKI